jgi:predicted lipid-binding transport protein (Tim44 family)
MTIDIIVFAIIALVIAYRFYNMLGDVDDNNPTNKRAEKGSVINLNKDQYEVKNANQNQVIDPQEEFLIKQLNDSSKLNLAKITTKDSDFLLHDFIPKTERAFELIIEAFCQGNKDILTKLTNKEMCQNFLEEFDKFQQENKALQINIVAMVKSSISNIAVSRNIAQITVVFISEQITVIKDNQDKIISGDKDKIEEIEDIWVFERNLNSSNHAWILVESKDK